MAYVIQKCAFTVGNAEVEVLMQGGFSEHESSPRVGMHSHPGYEVHYINGGSFLFTCGEIKSAVERDTLIVVPKRAYHAFEGISEPFRRLSFEIRLIEKKREGDLFLAYERLFSSLSSPLIIQSKLPELSCLESMMGEVLGEEEKCRLSAHFLLAFLKICELLRTESGTERQPSSRPPSARVSPGDADETLIRILNCINGNAARPLQISEVAECVNLSPRQVQRILLSKMGKSFSLILAESRMAYANELMSKYPEIPLSEVAYSCGYKSYVGFWQAYKRICGKTPRE